MSSLCLFAVPGGGPKAIVSRSLYAGAGTPHRLSAMSATTAAVEVARTRSRFADEGRVLVGGANLEKGSPRY